MTKINLPMNQYQLIPVYVKAVQLKQDLELPNVTWSQFYPNNAFVYCERGALKTAKVGDFLVLGQVGWSEIMDEESFRAKYKPTGAVL